MKLTDQRYSKLGFQSVGNIHEEPINTRTISCKASNNHIEYPSWEYKYDTSSMATSSIQYSKRGLRGTNIPGRCVIVRNNILVLMSYTASFFSHEFIVEASLAIVIAGTLSTQNRYLKNGNCIWKKCCWGAFLSAWYWWSSICID